MLGAAILHGKGLTVEDANMIETLSHMYRETFGQWSLWVFLAGAFAVLYSTVFGATASNARLFADGLEVFGLRRYESAEARVRMVRLGSILLPVAFTSVFLLFGNPVSLVFVGAVGQGLMLPFLAFAALHFHWFQTDPRPRRGPRVHGLPPALGHRPLGGRRLPGDPAAGGAPPVMRSDAPCYARRYP